MGRAEPAYETRSRSLKADRREGAQSFEHFINRQWVIWNEHPCYILVAADQASRGLGAYKLDLRSYPGQDKQVIWPKRPEQGNKAVSDFAKEVGSHLSGYLVSRTHPRSTNSH